MAQRKVAREPSVRPRAGRAARAQDGAEIFAALRAPGDIQAFLDTTSYSTEPIYRAPLRVARERRAHCVDGALFAAHALRRLGHPPLVVDMRAFQDDDHVIALFRARGRIGALAKSNCVALRYREPVYRSVRELVMSYFDWYFNTAGVRVMRSFTAPFDLRRFDALDWPRDDAASDVIVAALDRARHFELLTPAMIAALRPVDDRLYRAALDDADPAGLRGAELVAARLTRAP